MRLCIAAPRWNRLCSDRSDSQGEPIASALIILTAQATTGPGTVANTVLSGTVPLSTTHAVIQICVNQCGDVGTTDINVYAFQYTSSGGRPV